MAHPIPTALPNQVADTPVDAGDAGRKALDELLPIVYRELRAMAHHHLSRGGGGGGGGTLATTALVHEAWLKLADQPDARWRDRAHFLAVASVAMRNILVDRARARASIKRGGLGRHVTFDDDTAATERDADTLLAIDDALERLAAVAPRLAHVVVCRFYGGLSEEEIAQVLGVTARTVERDWAKARMLLRDVLAP